MNNYPIIKTGKTPFIKENKKNLFTFIDLFSGIGGTRIALQNVGGKCVFSSEWDKYCQLTYSSIFGEMPYGDITKIEKERIPNHDFLVAGFPCQPFSSIGKREGFKHKTQGILFYDIADILKIKKPPVFLLENVKGLVNHDNNKTLNEILNVLENKLDYQVFWKVLDASDYGVPQFRKRIYIVGFSKTIRKNKKILFQFPEKENNKVFINKFLEQNVTGYSITKHLQKAYIFKKDDGKPQIVDKNSRIRVKTLPASYHKIQRLTGAFVKDGPTGYRLFTENECKSIMGFPSIFRKLKFPVSRTQMYRQMGNSVAVPVVKKVALAVVEKLNELSNKKRAYQ